MSNMENVENVENVDENEWKQYPGAGLIKQVSCSIGNNTDGYITQTFVVCPKCRVQLIYTRSDPTCFACSELGQWLKEFTKVPKEKMIGKPACFNQPL